MNFTNDYNDQLEGNSLACKPGNIAKGLEGVCTYALPIIGSSSLINGLCFFYLAYIQHRHRMLVIKDTRKVARVPGAECSKNMRLEREHIEAFSYMERLLISLGVTITSFALSILVNGVGTMYSTTHVRGQIGDIAAASTFAAVWYISLLQHQGAIYFKHLLPELQGTIRHDNNTKYALFLSLMSKMFDIIQSWLAPVIALAFWGLLRAGVYTRGWYIFCMISMHCLCGLRSFVAIVFQRLATLNHLVIIVNAKNGTREENTRRRVFVSTKTYTLVLDLMTVLCNSVLLPASVLLFCSILSSWEFAIHMVVLGSILLIGQITINIHLYTKFNKLRRESGMYSKQFSVWRIRRRVLPSKGKSFQDGSSYVQQSEV